MKLNPFKKQPVQPSSGNLPPNYDNRVTDASSSAQAATYNGFPSYNAFPGAIWNPYSGNWENPASGGTEQTPEIATGVPPVQPGVAFMSVNNDPNNGDLGDVATAADPTYAAFPGGGTTPTYAAFPPVGGTDTVPTYSGFPPAPTLPAGLPAGATPDPANPDHYLYGGKGGGDEQNGYGETSVYDSNGNLLGTNQTFHLNGQTYNYGVDYGNSSPNLDSQGHFIAPNGSVSDYGIGVPSGGNVGSAGSTDSAPGATYAAFPGAGTTSQTEPLTAGQIAAGMGDGDNPLHGAPALPGSAGPSYSAFPSAGATTPDWQPADLNSLHAPMQTSSLEPHGMGMMMRDSKDGSKEIVQMTDGTYQSIDKKTGAVTSAGTWGDGHGGGVAQNGVSLASLGLPDNGTPASAPAAPAAPTTQSLPTTPLSPPVIPGAGLPAPDAVDRFVNSHSTPSTAADTQTAAFNQGASAAPAAPTAPASTDFHPPSVATAAAKSEDMFAQVPAPAAPAVKPAHQIAVTVDGEDALHGGSRATIPEAAAPVAKPKLTLPPASPHDLPLGGGFGGLDPSSSAHKYMGRH